MLTKVVGRGHMRRDDNAFIVPEAAVGLALELADIHVQGDTPEFAVAEGGDHRLLIDDSAKPKGAPASKTRKAAGRPPRSSRTKPDGEKLICRYCGSDDLAPSFRRRRDARCRACFKKRYGSAARHQKAVRPRKVKTAK
jgi:hypothetical protein